MARADAGSRRRHVARSTSMPGAGADREDRARSTSSIDQPSTSDRPSTSAVERDDRRRTSTTSHREPRADGGHERAGRHVVGQPVAGPTAGRLDQQAQQARRHRRRQRPVADVLARERQLMHLAYAGRPGRPATPSRPAPRPPARCGAARWRPSPRRTRPSPGSASTRRVRGDVDDDAARRRAAAAAPSWVSASGAITLTSKIVPQRGRRRASAIARQRARAEVPALLTSRSRRPRGCAARISAARCAGSVMSPAIGST